MDPREAEVQRHILRRIKEALGERSWNWLSGRSGVPQSTLASQAGRVDDPSDQPRFTLTTVVLVADALRRPMHWFFPGAEVDVRAEAYERIRAVVEETEPH